jgi:hypothetical protein
MFNLKPLVRKPIRAVDRRGPGAIIVQKISALNPVGSQLHVDISVMFESCDC